MRWYQRDDNQVRNRSLVVWSGVTIPLFGVRVLMVVGPRNLTLPKGWRLSPC